MRPSRRKWVLVLLGCAAFTAIGIFLVRQGEMAGWYVGAFFAFGTIISAVALFPGAGGLKLDADGFEVTNLFRRIRTRWQDASGFEPVAFPHAVMVGYDDASSSGSVAEFNRSLTGHNAALSDTFGLAPDHLAELMTLWRDRAQLQAASRP